MTHHKTWYSPSGDITVTVEGDLEEDRVDSICLRLEGPPSVGKMIEFNSMAFTLLGLFTDREDNT